MNFIYWIQTAAGLQGIISDDDPIFLQHCIITGTMAGCQGRTSKLLTDHFISTGDWRIVTNPLEAFAIEAAVSDESTTQI